MTTKDNITASGYIPEAGKPGRCVYVAGLARRLIRMGHTVIDMKPNRANHDKSVMVFEFTDKLENDLRTLIDLIKEKRESDITYYDVPNEGKAGRCVYVPGLARRLIRLGHRVIDMKPNRTDPTNSKSVIVFEASEKFEQDLKKLVEEIKAKRENDAGKSEVNEKIRETFLDNKE